MRRSVPLSLLVVIVIVTATVVGCPRPRVEEGEPGPGAAAEGEGEGQGEGEGEGTGKGEGEGEGAADDPFALEPDTSEGLTNTSADLEALLEHGDLEGACAAWEADPTNRRQELLCGKQMFFYEGFGTTGVPDAIFDFFGVRFPDVTGSAWSGYGLVPDPTRTNPARPLGVAPGAPAGSAPTQAFTCASCHFSKLPDGRFSVGAPNHDYAYGKQILAVGIAARRVAPGFDPAAHNPDAIAAVQPILSALDASAAMRLDLLGKLAPLIGVSQPALTPEDEGHYAAWNSGTMDFMMVPLPLDDGVHTVSKILSLWGVPSPAETSAAGMPTEQLAWTGGATSLDDFLQGFVAIGGGDESVWTRQRMQPLAEYIRSLRAPANPQPPSSDTIARGRQVFSQAGCLTCHDGPRGMGRRLYSFEEIGTDDAMRAWGDADLDGNFCCGFTGSPTHAIKSPRLVGLWAQRRLLHNGSISSVDELLCLTPRVADTRDAQGSDGHTFGCDLDVGARADLAAFLLSL